MARRTTPVIKKAKAGPRRPARPGPEAGAKAVSSSTFTWKGNFFVASKATPLAREKITTLSFPPGTATLTSPPGQGAAGNKMSKPPKGTCGFTGVSLCRSLNTWGFYYTARRTTPVIS